MVPARRRRSFRITWRAVAWAVLLVATALAVVLIGLSAALRGRQSALALQFMPGDGIALARRASEVLLAGNGNPAAMAQARIGAKSALSHDATLVEAWRTLALIEPEGSPAATRLLETAQKLSRRDIPTQLGLIEHRVQLGDIVGALNHYDIILRTSSAYDPLLFPILAGASSEPSVRRALAAKLVVRPTWRRRFLSYLVNSDTPIDQRADLFAALAAVGPLEDRDIVAAQASNSALGGQYAVADRLFAIVSPSRARRSMRDGGFDDDGGVPPYDWQLDTGDILDVAVAPFNGNPRLEIVSRRGDGGRAARQLMSLAPGKHRLTARYGAIDGVAPMAPRINVLCAEGGAAIASIGAAGAGALRGDMTVPATCRRQWLEIALPQNPAESTVGAWIDDIGVQSSAPGRDR